MGKRQKDICSFRYWRASEEIQNAQVLSMSSKSRDKRTYVWAKGKRTRVLLAIGKQEIEKSNFGRYVTIRKLTE